MKIAFDRQTERTFRCFEFRQGEIAPLALEADHITEEQKLFVLL